MVIIIILINNIFLYEITHRRITIKSKDNREIS